MSLSEKKATAATPPSGWDDRYENTCRGGGDIVEKHSISTYAMILTI